jgi:predicted acetyltransferase
MSCAGTPPTVTLKAAAFCDYPMVQNMARFYVYDLSKECGHLSKDWDLPADGLFESFDFKLYFTESTRQVYVITVDGSTAGFVLLHQDTIDPSNDWSMGEFFVLGRYQKQGIGQQVATQVWRLHPGKWEIAVIPENGSARRFWEKSIADFTQHRFTKETKEINFDKDQPQKIVFAFDASRQS